ncbi:MAG: helix-turn-helix transcriptional regulator [Nitrospirae bacterium]|nr:helix-turn-helix transcriptional regulator [Nitrospirota bacterium]
MDHQEMSELLRLLANPTRLRIVDTLRGGVRCVGDLEELLSLKQPNISQHVAVLRHAGIVDCYSDGKQRCYFLKDPRLPALLDAMSGEFPDELPPPPPPACFQSNSRGGCIASTTDPFPQG